MRLSEWLATIGLPEGWKRGAALPIARLESAGTAIDGKLYVFGGFCFRLKASKRVDVYDPVKNSWIQAADMPLPVTHVYPVFDGQSVWFAGGFVGDHPGPVTDDVCRYDPLTNTWERDIPLPAVRASGGFQLVNQCLHYFGGFAADRDTTCTEHWVLPLQDGRQWMKRAPLPEPLGHNASVVLNGKIYSMGGQYRHDTNPIDQTSVYVYDPSKDSWQALASLPEPRSHFEPGTFTYNGQIIVVGGRNNHQNRQDNYNFFRHQEDRMIDDLPHRAYRLLSRRRSVDSFVPKVTTYDPIADTWQDLIDLPAHLLAPVANVIQAQFILTGGGRNWVTNPQARTLLNESLLDLIPQQPY
ncbi:MAG: hypothetical protein KME35_10900 [Aphanocapsa sp. GSE-SYN-MK-11-07L]|nr:hypothetical protein [Aphanocapsa sp. GSE-SYN-MK-11-07L]